MIPNWQNAEPLPCFLLALLKTVLIFQMPTELVTKFSDMDCLLHSWVLARLSIGILLNYDSTMSAFLLLTSNASHYFNHTNL